MGIRIRKKDVKYAASSKSLNSKLIWFPLDGLDDPN